MKASVLGTGAWGTALAQILADNGHQVVMWGIERSQVDDININHRNQAYFQDIALNPKLKATQDIKEAVEEAQVLVCAVPTFAIAESLKKAAPYVKAGVLPVSVAKGFDPQTGDFVSKTIAKALEDVDHSTVVTLAGPSFAIEVVNRLLTCVTAASPDLKSAEKVQEAFSNNYFRVYTNDDEIGAELAGNIKNVIALASGCIAGLGMKVNTRAALITRGLSEMEKFVESQGGKADTVYGLTGVGDLILTCSSENSRNFQVGYLIGKTGNAKEVLANNKLTAEGVKTAKILHEKAEKAHVEMPISEGVYRVLYEGADVHEIINDLMNRPLRSEN